MKRSRIIFLDMDGVMNSHPYLSQERKKPDGSLYSIYDDDTWIEMIDPACVERLNRIVAATKADVVISSSWRHGTKTEKIAGWLRARGFEGQVIDRTPESAGDSRGIEIAAWLELHPEVESFIILDDDSDMAHLEDRLVKTVFEDGLLDHHVERAIELMLYNRP